MSESILFVVMAFMYAVGVFGVVLYGGSVYRGGFRDVMSGLAFEGRRHQARVEDHGHPRR